MSKPPVCSPWLLLILLASCGEPDCTIAETNLSGTIAEAPWEFAAGEVNAFLSEGKDTFFTKLYPNDFDPCEELAPQGGSNVIVSVPREPGDYAFDNYMNMTFVVESGLNVVTFSGRLRVDEVTETEVKGGLCASADGGNDVSGTFTAAICPD